MHILVGGGSFYRTKGQEDIFLVEHGMEPSSPFARKRKRSILPLLYSIDVLTDGSEGTSDASVFLSVWQQTPSAGLFVDNEPNPWWQGVPQARYALHLGSDTCSRLATDQRYKLAATKAVLGNSLWGWKALQLALERAGAAQIHVVSSHPAVEEIVDRRDALCPMVHLCDLGQLETSSTASEVRDTSPQWWQVYCDEYLVVHAQVVNASKDDSSDAPSLTFLYTLLGGDAKRDVSFLVLPASCTMHLLEETKIHSQSLPVLDNHTIQCNFILALHPSEHLAVDNIPIFSVQPSIEPCYNLLVRARRQAQEWHHRCPRHFPLNFSYISDSVLNDAPKDNLPAGTSLCWWGSNASSPSESNLDFHRLDRLKGMHNHEADTKGTSAIGNTSVCSSNGSSRLPRHTWPDKLKDFFESTVPYCTPCDDNEIDIDDADETNDNDGNGVVTTALETPDCVLELFCLGTGCAAPSAYRGASAYLIRHQTTCILLEAGEGVVTQYLRHVSKDEQSLLNISLIWVSHAHWDHYGGLVPLLAFLARQRKQAKLRDIPAPILLAPRIVIRYCRNVLCQKKDGDWFYGASHEDGSAFGRVLGDWNTRCGSLVAFWENVLVDHSCRSSYGCVLGLRVQGRQKPFTIAFSGDTRPCLRFVQVCQRRAVDGAIDFLIHEATFDDDQGEMSIKKKHSTIREAIRIGQDVCATKILLSHFSQRYDSLVEIPPNLSKQVGFALDGMRVVLI